MVTGIIETQSQGRSRNRYGREQRAEEGRMPRVLGGEGWGQDRRYAPSPRERGREFLIVRGE